jgi:hypothetical protein
MPPSGRPLLGPPTRFCPSGAWKDFPSAVALIDDQLMTIQPHAEPLQLRRVAELLNGPEIRSYWSLPINGPRTRNQGELTMTDDPERAWETSDTFYSAVGQGISFWTSMEARLVQIAARLMGTTDEKAGLLLYSIMNFHSWLNSIDELFALEPRYSEQRQPWQDTSAKLRGLNDTRVRLAHHTVWRDDTFRSGRPSLLPGQFDTRIKSRKYKPLELEEIYVFSNSVLETEKELMKIIQAMDALKT